MKTYQDLLMVLGNEDQLKRFIEEVINEHKSSDDYEV